MPVAWRLVANDKISNSVHTKIRIAKAEPCIPETSLKDLSKGNDQEDYDRET